MGNPLYKKMTNLFSCGKWIVVFTLFVFLFDLSAQELIVDPHFQRGLRVKEPTTGADQGVVQWTEQNGSPVWTCAQWNSQSSLIDIEPDTLASGWLQWANADKTVRMGPQGAEDYDLYLGVDSNSEYGGVYRTASQPWPHLLVEQRLSPPNAAGPGCPPLSDLKSLQFHVQARLDTANIIKKDGYNANIHAAQYLIYFTIQNLNRQSPGYGKIIWLGVPVYDDRYPKPAKYVAHDDGTQTLIYTLAYENVAATSTHNGEWVSLQVDLLPHALRALNEAWRRGYLGDSKNLSDYKIGGMNMGWECPGLEIVAMKVRNLSLVAEIASDVESSANADSPSRFVLYPNYPNPFNSGATIPYEIAGREMVKLMIFDVNGRQAATLVNEVQNPGAYRVTWDARGWAAGVYFYQLWVGSRTACGKMVLAK